MEAKLGQNAGDCGRLFLCELNPNPFTDNLRGLKKLRCLALKQSQKLCSFKRAIRTAATKINLRSGYRLPVCIAEWFGTVQEPCLCIFLCVRFHGLFLVFSRFGFGLSPFTKRPRSRAARGSSLQRAPCSGPLRKRAGEGDNRKTEESENDLKTKRAASHLPRPVSDRSRAEV